MQPPKLNVGKFAISESNMDQLRHTFKKSFQIDFKNWDEKHCREVVKDNLGVNFGLKKSVYIITFTATGLANYAAYVGKTVKFSLRMGYFCKPFRPARPMSYTFQALQQFIENHYKDPTFHVHYKFVDDSKERQEMESTWVSFLKPILNNRLVGMNDEDIKLAYWRSFYQPAFRDLMLFD